MVQRVSADAPSNPVGKEADGQIHVHYLSPGSLAIHSQLHGEYLILIGFKSRMRSVMVESVRGVNRRFSSANVNRVQNGIGPWGACRLVRAAAHTIFD